MNNILVIGAGRSSHTLIEYILTHAKKYNWFVTVADAKPELAEEKIKGHPNARATWLDVTKVNDRRDMISRADLVVTLLPAHLHLEVGHDCIKLKKRLITASFVSREMYRLGDEARDRELMFMGEMGLDPGIDHMSAMKKIDEIKAQGGQLTAFRSFRGGLIAPESDNNPWHYKFTWNPRNIILAGQGTAQYLENNKLKYVPYNRLYADCRTTNIPGIGDMEYFIDRDSLLYKNIYGLKGVPNVLRGTLRHKGFCAAWNALIQLGLTDGSYPILNSGDISYHALMEAYISNEYTNGSVKDRIAQMLGEEADSDVMHKLEWLGLFRKKKIKLPNATPALILEHLLLDKWELARGDKDLVLMKHEFEYLLNGKKHLSTAHMVIKGEDEVDTAMAKLVGLPMGIVVKMVMQGQITEKGVHIPVQKEVYEPVLKELAEHGLCFEEEDTIID